MEGLLVTPSEVKLRILAEWRTWIGHRQEIRSHTPADAALFVDHLAATSPDLLAFEGADERVTLWDRLVKPGGAH